MRTGIASLALLFAAAASADEPALRIEVEPKQLHEGRRTTLIVKVINGGSEPVALAQVELALGPAKRTFSLAREERGSDLSPLGGGVVTARLRAEEGDLGPVARGPRAPLVRELGDDLFLVHRTLAAGQSLAFELEVAPLAPRDAELLVEVEAITSEQLRAGNPHGPLGITSTRLPGPERGATVEVSAQRWEPIAAEAPLPGEVLFGREAARRLLARRVRLTQGIALVAGDPTSFAALARLNLKPADVEAAAFLPAVGTWVFDLKDLAVIVPRDLPATRHARCALATLAHALATGEPVALRVPADEPLLSALKQAGLEPVPSQAKDRHLELRLAPGDLSRLLAALGTQGWVIRGTTIER